MRAGAIGATRHVVSCAGALALLLAAALAVSVARPAEVTAGDGDVVPGEFIVRTSLDVQPGAALVESTGADATATYDLGADTFVVAQADATEAAALASDPRVLSISPNRVITASATQTSPPWGLDRIDQVSLPLDGLFRYNSAGAGVKAYVVDSGIRSTHVDVAGRVATGYDAGGFGGAGTDCSPVGHGTHVAGTIGGTTYGVAKAVTLVPVRVFGCANSTTTDVVIAGLSWIVQDHAANTPAVANMSLGGDAIDTALEAAVRAAVADGVTVVVAAGNANVNACTTSPARMPEVITVGSSSQTDARSSFSNFGSCVALFAPGESIVSASSTSNTGSATLSGTSMATPHVAGAVARLLSEQPTLTPAQVATTVLGRTTTVSAGRLLQSPLATWVLSVTRAGDGSGTVTSTPSGIDCGAVCSAIYVGGSTVELAATAGSGQRFAGWSGACTGSSLTCTVSIAGATSVIATFETVPVPTSTLSVSRAGTGTGRVTSTTSGIDCGAVCSASFVVGSAVNLVPTPDPGSRFAGWSGACTGSSPTCSVTIGDPTSVTATFAPAVCASVSSSGRVGLWKGSGSTAGVNGPTLVGSPVYGAGFVGQGFVLDGSSSLSSSSMATVTDAITVMAWVKPTSMVPVQSVISRSTGPGMTGVSDVSHGYSLRLGSPWGVEWEVDDPGGLVPEELRAQAYSLLSDGGWHHVAATWGAGSMAVFVDGVEVARQRSTSSTINAATSTSFVVGGEQASPFAFIGSLDEPTVFNRVLTASELASVYAAATTGLC